MNASELFVAALRKYDTRLRVRWGVRTEKWIIERKMAERSPTLLTEKPNPYKSPRGLDLLDGWKDGYVCVLMVDPSMLHWALVEAALRDADITVQGSWEAISRRIDAEQAAEERAADKRIANWSEAAASEAYDRLMWLQGNRIATPLAEDPASTFVEEAHEGFRVRTKKSLLGGG